MNNGKISKIAFSSSFFHPIFYFNTSICDTQSRSLVHFTKGRFTKVRLTKVSFTKVRFTKVRFPKVRFTMVRLTKVRFTNVRFTYQG